MKTILLTLVAVIFAIGLFFFWRLLPFVIVGLLAVFTIYHFGGFKKKEK